MFKELNKFSDKLAEFDIAATFAYRGRPAVMQREISSRSPSLSATGALRRGAGAIFPLTAKIR